MNISIIFILLRDADSRSYFRESVEADSQPVLAALVLLHLPEAVRGPEDQGAAVADLQAARQAPRALAAQDEAAPRVHEARAAHARDAAQAAQPQQSGEEDQDRGAAPRQTVQVPARGQAPPEQEQEQVQPAQEEEGQVHQQGRHRAREEDGAVLQAPGLQVLPLMM